ncbi:AAA family ATPase [Stieleria sp. JC731]|uniref:ATPase domain-containing protein n=1 Tax=Pirellulaceae TaxID=2691357 RepID=UPI001E2FC4E4|nr:ATPase domain-containing protein [Stieleria sp. JC731]MCC9600370.1 AAA family ATPase [Stieleria sp. JC731]
MNGDAPRRISTGIATLDGILHGGLEAERLYLVEGTPGTGKTTLGLQYLLEGRVQGEKGFYVTLSETREELIAIARSHGWSLDGIEIHELVDPQGELGQGHYTMFEPGEIELGNTLSSVQEHIESFKPNRLVFDSLSEMRLLSQGAFRYRRQILALKQFLSGRNCTTLLLDDKAAGEDHQLQSLSHGVIRLEQQLTDYGKERRYLRVIKYRGSDFAGGVHDLLITRGGLVVYPQWLDHETQPLSDGKHLSSGLPALDKLLGGGVAEGSSTLLLGPAGVGKSTMGVQFAVEAAKRGDRAVLFEFEESEHALLNRSDGLGLPLRKFISEGLIEVFHLRPGEVTPNEFASLVRSAVEVDKDGRRTSVVIIDSLNGYLNAMPHEKFLVVHLNDILHYLGRRRVGTFLVVAQHGMLGRATSTPVDTSYLADAVILFRYFEAAGQIHRAISVVKNRTFSHEHTIREFALSAKGLHIGEPLKNFRGVFSGTPEFVGAQEALMPTKGQRFE